MIHVVVWAQLFKWNFKFKVWVSTLLFLNAVSAFSASFVCNVLTVIFESYRLIKSLFYCAGLSQLENLKYLEVFYKPYQTEWHTVEEIKKNLWK